MKKQLILFVLILSITSCEFKYQEMLWDKTNLFPAKTGLLNDYENIFTDEQKNELDGILSDFAHHTQKEIFIVSVKSFKPYQDFQKFTVDLGTEWQIGKDNNENAILIVFSKENRKIGLSIPDNITGLTAEEGQAVVSNIVIPEFKRNKFYNGIKNGILQLISKWE